MTDEPFTHDPTDQKKIPPDAPTSLDEATAALEETDAEGLGFALTRHDPFLVVEVGGTPWDSGEFPYPVDRILDAWGMTFAERDGDILRLLYEGSLPEDLTFYDRAPVVVTVSGEETYPFRLFDSGWTPITGNHIAGTPDTCEQIDTGALVRFLEVTGAFDD